MVRPTFVHSVSLVSGYLSIGCWLFAQLPQVIENYKNHSVDGIALGFLASWIAGDLSNLIGGLLTGALPFQIWLASYYCCIDVILASQFLYYTKLYPHIQRHLRTRLRKMTDSEDDVLLNSDFPQEHIASPKPITIGVPKENTQQRLSKGLLNFGPGSNSFSNIVTGSFLASFSKVQGAPIYHKDSSPPTSPVQILIENSHLVGIFFAWACTCLYLTARIPQLIKNYHRKSTAGLSILLFICALNGNFFYTISILTCDEFAAAPSAMARYEFFMKELPYILGSAGTIAFDLVALYQWKIYKKIQITSPAIQETAEQPPNDQLSRSLTTSLESYETKSNEAFLRHHNHHEPLQNPEYASLINGPSSKRRSYGSTSLTDSTGKTNTKDTSTPLTPWDLLEIPSKPQYLHDFNNE